MKNLLDISADMQALFDLIEECEGDISGQAEEAVTQWLNEIEGDLSNKADNYAGVIRMLEARSEVRKAEADRLYAKAKTDASRADWLRDRLMTVLQRLDIPKVETQRFTVSVQRNGGLAGVEVVGDVPPDYRRVVSQPDLALIRAALQEGAELGFAYLKPRGFSLRIK